MSAIKKESEKTEILGLYLNFKTRTKYTSGIFDYSSTQNNLLNTYITNRAKQMMFFVRTEDNNIKAYYNQGDFLSGEQLLFYILPRKKSFQFGRDLKYIFNLEIPDEKNIELLNNLIWYVINSNSEKNINPNPDYYLSEGDIIKIGKVKYIVKNIVIGNIAIKSKDKQFFNLIPECSDFKKCDYCNENIFRLCKCENQYIHVNCVKEWIDERIITKKNNKKTVTNYYFPIMKCDEFLKIKEDCAKSNHRYCECDKCNTYYPLKFKYKYNHKDEKENNEIETEEIIDFYPIEIINKENYMILESLEYCDNNINTEKVIKAIHVIDLTKEDIFNIGRASNNDIVVNHSSVNKNHAVIIYKDGKLLLKNLSDKAGTLVLIKNTTLDISNKKKEIYLQIDKTFIEAKLMEEKDFLETKKNNYTKYPIIDKKKVENNSKEAGSQNNTDQNQTNNSSNVSEKDSNGLIAKNEYNYQPSYAAKFYGND